MNKEYLPQEMADVILSIMSSWSEEQLKDFNEARQNGDWTEYDKKYNIKNELKYKKYDTVEDCNLETGQIIKFNSMEEADRYFDEKAKNNKN